MEIYLFKTQTTRERDYKSAKRTNQEHLSRPDFFGPTQKNSQKSNRFRLSLEVRVAESLSAMKGSTP
jgi:hypothetical protein